MQLSELRGWQDRRHAHRSGSVPANHLLDARAGSQQFLLAVAGRGRGGDLAALASHFARFTPIRQARGRRRRGRRARGRRRRRRQRR